MKTDRLTIRLYLGSISLIRHVVDHVYLRPLWNRIPFQGLFLNYPTFFRGLYKFRHSVSFKCGIDWNIMIKSVSASFFFLLNMQIYACVCHLECICSVSTFFLPLKTPRKSGWSHEGKCFYTGFCSSNAAKTRTLLTRETHPGMIT